MASQPRPPARGHHHDVPLDDHGFPILQHRQILVIISGLMLTMLLAQLDNMIVAPALPTIVGELGGMTHVAWVTTAYILTSTIATPIWGKFGDMYGRRRMFLAAIVLFLIGSALCGLSRNMTELILFRGFQGIGGGGLLVSVFSVMGVIIPPRNRGKYMGYFMAVMPAAMIAGPSLGGLITEHISWNWIFYVNLPLGIAALFVVNITMRGVPETLIKARLDTAGIVLAVLWIAALVLFASWGGTEFEWGSWQIIALGVVAVVGFVAFLFVEHRAEEPLIPLRFFAIRNYTLAAIVGFVVGFGMFGGMTFIPQYQQFVQGQNATNSGLLLMPMMLGMMAVSLTVGQIISRTGHYRVFPVVGTVIMIAALFELSRLDAHASILHTSLLLVLLGAGMGFLMQTTSLIAQNSVQMRDLGAATGTSTFVRNIGGSLGIAVLGSVFTHQLTGSLGQLGGAAGGGEAASGSLTPEALQALPTAVQILVKQGMTDAVTEVFLVAALMSIAGFVASLFIKQVALRAAPQKPANAPGAGPADAS
ncbi:MFS transporter [Micrococcales bacterium 31B]|nr:MFS transporter [Micrococcales bacterium 31B]